MVPCHRPASPHRCALCEVGTHDHDADARTPCRACPAGTMQPQNGSVGCTLCGNGTYDHDSSALTPCAACRPGWETLTQDGATNCTRRNCTASRVAHDPGGTISAPRVSPHR